MQNFGNPVLSSPSIDFRAVRDQRRASLFYYDLDLSIARTATNLNALLLNVSGNVVYIDADPTGGSALIHFQDGNYDRGPVPVYASPGAIFNVPFTQLLIENPVQPGKKIRIIYGVDVDFQPGSVAQVTLSGSATDDYIAKSVNAQNYTATSNTSIAVGTQSYFLLKNISSSNVYRINDASFTLALTGNQPTAAPTISQLIKYITVTQTSPGNTTNTKTYTPLLANLTVNTTTPTASVGYVVSNSYLQQGNFVGKSPIYVNPGDGVAIVISNNTAASFAASTNINYDVI